MQKIKTDFLWFEYYLYLLMFITAIILQLVSLFSERGLEAARLSFLLVFSSLTKMFRCNFAWVKGITLSDDYLQVETQIMQFKIRLEDLKINLLRRDQHGNEHLRIRFPGRLERKLIFLDSLDFRAIVLAESVDSLHQWFEAKGVTYEFGE